MESTQRVRKPRAEFVYIDGPRYYPGVDRSGPPATIGTEEGCDFIQQPWPTEPSVWDVSLAYLREWVITERCDLPRSTAAFFRFFKACEPHRSARSITRAEGRDFVTMRRGEGVSDGTIRRDLTVVQAAFGHAEREDRLEKAVKFSMPKPAAPRVRFLTEDEYRRLLQVIKPHRRQMFWLLAFETGCRSRAIEELKWSQVDLVNRRIDFRTPGKNHKNKRRPIAPINDRLYPRLLAAKKRHDEKCPLDPFVIGKGCTTYQGCKEDLAAIGIVERGVARHVARHTFCSWRVQRGISYAKIGKLIGDNASMVELVYGHLLPEHLVDASNMEPSALRSAA